MDDLSVLFARFQQLLEEERAALLGGNPERIITAARRKLEAATEIEALAARPETARPDSAAVAQAARYNRDNAVICAAMLRHLTMALDKLRRAEPHRSYLPDGSERNPPARQTLGAA